MNQHLFIAQYEVTSTASTKFRPSKCEVEEEVDRTVQVQDMFRAHDIVRAFRQATKLCERIAREIGVKQVSLVQIECIVEDEFLKGWVEKYVEKYGLPPTQVSLKGLKIE